MTDDVMYEPQIIKAFAWRLYRKAGAMVLLGAFGGAALGAVVGAVLGSSLDASGPVGAVVALVGLFVGMALAEHAAFRLKLQAQMALCQVQIEENTRLAAQQHLRLLDRATHGDVRLAGPANTNAA